MGKQRSESGKDIENKMKNLLMGGAAAMLLVPLVVLADTYQFIISGDPVAAETVRSHAAVSSSTSLVTGARTAPTVSASLEARYRTWNESNGTAIRSDKSGFIIMVR